MGESKISTLTLIIGIITLLFFSNIGLFIRTIQLQKQVSIIMKSYIPFHLSGLEKGTLAPDFNLTNTKGLIITRKSLEGKNVLLVFSSPKCQACKQIYPYLKTLSQIKTDIRLIMISLADIEENIQLIKEEELDFMVLNGDLSTIKEFKVRGVPFFYFIDDKGVIINSGFAPKWKQLEKIINSER